jgi:GTP-binding protein Era
MLNFSRSALSDADVLLYVTDVYDNSDKNSDFVEKVKQNPASVILIINKIDLINEEKLVALVEKWKTVLPQAEIFPISATEKFNIEPLLKRIQELLPEGEPFFDKDQLTDKPAKFFVTEIIREKILLNYDKEIPYSVEVEVEQFQEEEKIIRISAVIYAERDSQKGILIGHGGKSLKKVGTESRKDIEAFFEKKVFLELFVKVEKDWRNKDSILKNFGYKPE